MECLKNQFSNGIILDGRYKTISPLNHGSFGMVFMAKDMFTADTVAIKCLTKKTAATEVCGEFAIDEKSEEFGLHSRIGSHPNIVNLLRSFETESHHFLVLEFCQRGDLYEAIREGRGPLETEHVRQFMLELLDAVSYIHSKGVYHRDIKPENIFLTQAGSMKLGDFGLATSEKWTMENTVGSDRYMSPEQYDSAGAGYSPGQADIWAVGVCLLNILFSRNPFTSPTEADPLFLDFSRDKQSLFDVFPSMSQDTYEVIVQCMNLDPRRRSLEGAREALLNVVSFTTTDETLDDFCSAQPRTCATARREPLRTPSIQSPFVEQGAFPWAKALQGTPRQPICELGAIPDYEEELFSRSEETSDWCSRALHTPVSSLMDSSLGGSMQSLAPSRPQLLSSRTYRQQLPMPGSLPISMTKPKTLSATPFAFDQGVFSKSWSDLWDEEEEEEEEERTRQLQTLKEINSRTWSHESVEIVEAKNNAMMDKENHPHPDLARGNVDDDFVADGFFFQEAPAPSRASPMPSSAPRYSPPPKRNGFDKWAALGERRRGYGSASDTERESSLSGGKTQRQLEFGHASSWGMANWEHYHQNNYRTLRAEKGKECPWNIGRDCNRRREKRAGLGDIEWVGIWPEVHT